jgi:hypothetical protein
MALDHELDQFVVLDQGDPRFLGNHRNDQLFPHRYSHRTHRYAMGLDRARLSPTLCPNSSRGAGFLTTRIGDPPHAVCHGGTPGPEEPHRQVQHNLPGLDSAASAYRAINTGKLRRRRS